MDRVPLQPLAGLAEGPVITYMVNLCTQTINNNKQSNVTTMFNQFAGYS